MKRIVGLLMVMCLMFGVTACSDPDQGPELGDFPAITKQETDPPFNITAPSSKSPEPFSFTSSKPEVATISGSLVTIKGPGQTTITASQPGTSAWGPTSKSTTLTVNAVACDGGSTRINGVCTPIPPCTEPASIQNNQCVPPSSASSAKLVQTSTLTWMGVSFPNTWSKAQSYCANTLIDNKTGWRQPTVVELQALRTSGLIAGQGWLLGPTWSSNMAVDSDVAAYTVVDLATGDTAGRSGEAFANVACVHTP
jgi:hypothetical protein